VRKRDEVFFTVMSIRTLLKDTNMRKCDEVFFTVSLHSSSGIVLPLQPLTLLLRIHCITPHGRIPPKLHYLYKINSGRHRTRTSCTSYQRTTMMVKIESIVTENCSIPHTFLSKAIAEDAGCQTIRIPLPEAT